MSYITAGEMDVVKLTGVNNAPEMLVVDTIIDHIGALRVKCEWFDNLGRIQSHIFKAECLTVVATYR